MTTTIQTTDPVALNDLWEISERLCIGTLRQWQASIPAIRWGTVSEEWRIAGVVLGCHVRSADTITTDPRRYVMTWTVNGTRVRRRRALELITEVSAVRFNLKQREAA